LIGIALSPLRQGGAGSDCSALCNGENWQYFF
jgi:hypothetical protein